MKPVLHALLDGRDTPPRSGEGYLARIVPHLDAAHGCVATVIGRYWAMDRDNRWDRVGRAYHAIVCRDGIPAPDALAAVRAAYARDEGDEFVQPTVIDGGPALEDGDAAIFFNFRADRAREITNALTSAHPTSFEGQLERKKVVKPGVFVCMTEYDAEFGLPVAFAPDMPTQILGEVLAAARLPQLRMAETEKYAHVTFFFNNGREEPFEGEDRLLVPSPRDVATYDHKPEMSAEPLTRALLERARRARLRLHPDQLRQPGHGRAIPACWRPR